MMNMNLLRSHMIWSQVAWDWQRDWTKRTARQTVILPTDLTLSFERLMFLGKSHSACCPVSSYSWHRPGDGARENGIQRADQTKRVGRMWVKVWIKLSLQVSLRVEIILIHLWIFLMFSNCISFPPTTLTQHAQTLPWHTAASGCQSLSATLKSPQVSVSKDLKKGTSDNKMHAWWNMVAVVSAFFSGHTLLWFFSTSVQIRCHYWADKPEHLLQSRGLDLDGLSKQMQQWFLLSFWLKLTHTPLAGSTVFSGTGRQ